MTFQEAEATLNGRLRKRLATNTWLMRLNADRIGVVYHSTAVVIIHRNGDYMLNSDGWHTTTTKRRMNQYSPFRVWQKNFNWYVNDGEGDIDFTDGITLKS